jgi:PAS domain S-box-containing protein
MITDAEDYSDNKRDAVLKAYPFGITNAEQQLDRIAELAAKLCEAPVGLVSIVETDRQCFIGRSGTELTETPRDQSFCAFAMLDSQCMIVNDARIDPRFADNPLVDGPPGIRFYAGQPLKSREGIPLGSLCVIDTKPRDGLTDTQQLALETLAEAAMALLERGRSDESSLRFRNRSESEIADLQQRFQILADAMPQLVWSTDVDGMVDYVNQGWLDYIGQPAEASYGTRWMRFLHADDKKEAERCWLGAVGSGTDYEVEYRLNHHQHGYRWVLARGLPMFGADGAIVRWIGTCTDIQEQKADAERLDLLSRELSHRIKNIFAVIGGLIALTSRSKPEFKELAVEFRDRVLALGRAHDFVRSNGTMSVLGSNGKLSGLLKNLLAPYQDERGNRIEVAGDEVEIDDRSATPLALFVHELATNAAKYGALANNGRIKVTVNAGAEVSIHWRETGGPPVACPASRGFGSALIEMSVIRQLGGTLDLDWGVEGLTVEARIPAAALARQISNEVD